MRFYDTSNDTYFSGLYQPNKPFFEINDFTQLDLKIQSILPSFCDLSRWTETEVIDGIKCISADIDKVLYEVCCGLLSVFDTAFNHNSVMFPERHITKIGRFRIERNPRGEQYREKTKLDVLLYLLRKHVTEKKAIH